MSQDIPWSTLSPERELTTAEMKFARLCGLPTRIEWRGHVPAFFLVPPEAVRAAHLREESIATLAKVLPCNQAIAEIDAAIAAGRQRGECSLAPTTSCVRDAVRERIEKAMRGEG